MASIIDKNCTILIHRPDKGNPPSQEEVIKDLQNPKVEIKIHGMKTAIQALLAGESMPRVLMQVIQYCVPNQDHNLKKLLMIYWEVVPKTDMSGKLLPEMILVCNALRNDLIHANEFVRGCMLRFLCKLREPELLEPLIASIKSNLEHRHSFVRRNAVMAVFHIHKSFGEQLIPDAPDLIEKLILTETDMNTRRNAFLMLFNCAQDRAVAYLTNNFEQVSRYGDGFSLVILELVRKICRQDPQQKARFVRCIYQLLNSGSAAVAYEAAWTLVSLSAAPTAVRAAASTHAALLNTQSDNNVKLIVLDRLEELKEQHSKVLQEIMMDIMRALSSPNTDIRKKVLDIAMDLISPRNVDEVIAVLKREVLKTQDKDMEKSNEYRQLLIKAIHNCAVKFPEVSNTVVHVLMEFLGGDGALDVIYFVRAISESYPDLRSSILGKLLTCFPDIKSGRVYRVALWIIGEYIESEPLIQEAVRIVKVSLGALPLQAVKKEEQKISAPQIQTKAITKNIILSDGTYATETVLDAPVKSAEEPEATLRRLILSGDFYLSSAAAVCLTKLALRAMLLFGPQSPAAKIIVVESMMYMSSIISYGLSSSSKWKIDSHSRERISLCLRVLADQSLLPTVGRCMLEDCRQSFSSFLRLQKEQEQKTRKSTTIIAHADDLISIRQLRGTKSLGATEIDIDDGADISRATGSKDASDFDSRLAKIFQLTGFADPVYAEAHVTVHDYDIILEILLINRTPNTLTNLTVELATMGDLKLVERPQSYTIGPLDHRTIKANIKVSSTETGHVFGTIVYDTSGTTEKTIVNLNDIHMDIMDYIQPASCSDTAFRAMWAEFEWENKVAVNTAITNLAGFLEHIVSSTNMRCLTPVANNDETSFLAANLYAKSVFGEDALINLSVEKQEDGKITGYIRIRSKTQGIALSLGDRITAVQRGEPKTSHQDKTPELTEPAQLEDSEPLT